MPKLGTVLALHVGHPAWSVSGAVTTPHRRSGVVDLIANSHHVTLTFTRVAQPSVIVSHVVMGDQSVSFHVSRIGVPILVKISFYPRWHAVGADGPYRVSPNLMVVVPRSLDVSLRYGSSPTVTVGNFLTDLTVLALVVAVWRRRWWRRPHFARTFLKS